MLLSWTVAVLMLPAFSAVSAQFPVNVVVIRDTDEMSPPYDYRRNVPATNMAEGHVKSIYSKFINFTFIYRDASCSGDGTGALVADLHCEHVIGVFIGPGCNNALEALGPLSRSWNIPVITPIGSGLSDAKLRWLLTKLSPYSATSFVKAVVALLIKFEWFKVAIIYDEDYTTSNLLKNGLAQTFGNSFLLDHTSFQFNSNAYTSEQMRSILVDASVTSRVFIILCNTKESRALMLQANSLGYATSGQYVFIIIESLSTLPSRETWKLGQRDDQTYLKSLGQAIWPYVGLEKYINTNFTAEVMNRSLRDYGFDYNGTEPGPHLSGYYDAVTMYATVLNETLSAGADPLNGTDITRRLWNRTFPGINRPVMISDEGFRQVDITFGFFDVVSGQFSPADRYDYDSDLVEDITGQEFAWPYNDGLPPLNEPTCGFDDSLCVDTDIPVTLISSVSALLVVLAIAGIIGGLILYRSWKRQYEKDLWWWKIASTDLTFISWNQCSSMYLVHSKMSSLCKQYSQRNVSSLGNNSVSDRAVDSNLALWKGQTVSLRCLPVKQLTLTRAGLIEFKMVRDVNHANLVRIVGACLEETIKVLVTEHCVKGSLQDLIWNVNINLDAQFKFSLCTDIINGLCYIHESPIRQHGRLTSQACLIDNRFSVKLTDFGLPSMYSSLHVEDTSEQSQRECLWKAPEILRSQADCIGTTEGDIYSYGIILQELVTRDEPFAAESVYMTTPEIIQKVKDGGSPAFRPYMELPVTMQQFGELIQACWSEDAKCRPSCQSVKSSIKRISGSLGDSGNLMDNLMRRMEQYANNLEKMVEEKTVELREEKKKSEELLYQILPRSVADRLKSGLRVEPQVYEGVSIYFSDIVGFTEISAVSSPMEVVDLLNDVYSCFDAIIEEFDVYKVETIGDAYMVVSGLPQRNGQLHAINIANMSLKILETVREFRIRHMPTEKLQIRIGLHSGPVCAGVVGLKMPRYCLFGDTVNTASRMESSGQAMMIHISVSTKELLEQLGAFRIAPRGSITVKGKGKMFTYWLLTSQDKADDPLIYARQTSADASEI